MSSSNASHQAKNGRKGVRNLETNARTQTETKGAIHSFISSHSNGVCLVFTAMLLSSIVGLKWLISRSKKPTRNEVELPERTDSQDSLYCNEVAEASHIEPFLCDFETSKDEVESSVYCEVGLLSDSTPHGFY
eukprot:g8073.t1